MMEIYSVESRKGGVGKTTIALNLAKALARRNYDVLLLDCDITGTPISNAAIHSEFWKKEVVVSLRDGKPYNLIDFFENEYLRGDNSVKSIINGLDYNPRKIHLIGSEIYKRGELIIDPRDLMDDIHSFWFLKMVRDIASEFEQTTIQTHKAIILDNSPGYVGIGRSIREWMAKECPQQARFLLVSSLDEQDIESTISSASEIKRMFGNGYDIRSHVKVVINKVPEDLLDDGSGYRLCQYDGDDNDELVKTLFPLDKNKYPKNIIKYDKAISAQFIEASLIPKKSDKESDEALEGALRTFEKKVMTYDQKSDQYADILSLDQFYRKFLQELNNSGYARLSKSIGGTLQPKNITRKLEDIVGLLGNMVRPEYRNNVIIKEELRDSAQNTLSQFIEDRHLSEFSPIYHSLLNGIYKVAGYERKGANLYQMFNLNVMIAAYCAFQKEFYHAHYDTSDEYSYKSFLNDDAIKKRAKEIDERFFIDRVVMVVGQRQIEYDGYINNLIKAYFSRFYQAMCYTVIRMIDCKSDYQLLMRAYKETRSQKAKMMSEDLTSYLKNVIVRKSERQDERKYTELVVQPFEMKAIQSLLSSFILK